MSGAADMLMVIAIVLASLSAVMVVIGLLIAFAGRKPIVKHRDRK